MFDFDKNFEDYVARWNSNRHVERKFVYDYDAYEQGDIPELYAKWLVEPIDELGMSPKEFFDRMSPDDLLKRLKLSAGGEKVPSSPLLDKLAETPECLPGLKDIIKKSKSVDMKLFVLRLINRMNVEKQFDYIVSLVFDESMDGDVRDEAIEILSDYMTSEYADEVMDKLYAVLPKADMFEKGIIAEILVNGKRDERTYNLLCEIFNSGEDLLCATSLIGKYGDERALPMLYRSLAVSDYAEFRELKSTIERMGGEVDFYRDFSDDPSYIAVQEENKCRIEF